MKRSEGARRLDKAINHRMSTGSSSSIQNRKSMTVKEVPSRMEQKITRQGTYVGNRQLHQKASELKNVNAHPQFHSNHAHDDATAGIATTAAAGGIERPKKAQSGKDALKNLEMAGFLDMINASLEYFEHNQMLDQERMKHHQEEQVMKMKIDSLSNENFALHEQIDELKRQLQVSEANRERVEALHDMAKQELEREKTIEQTKINNSHKLKLKIKETEVALAQMSERYAKERVEKENYMRALGRLYAKMNPQDKDQIQEPVVHSEFVSPKRGPAVAIPKFKQNLSELHLADPKLPLKHAEMETLQRTAEDNQEKSIAQINRLTHEIRVKDKKITDLERRFQDLSLPMTKAKTTRRSETKEEIQKRIAQELSSREIFMIGNEPVLSSKSTTNRMRASKVTALRVEPMSDFDDEFSVTNQSQGMFSLRPMSGKSSGMHSYSTLPQGQRLERNLSLSTIRPNSKMSTRPLTATSARMKQRQRPQTATLVNNR